jgi:hypothetical protein
MFGLMTALVLVGVLQSWSLALTILNYCLIAVPSCSAWNIHQATLACLP